MMALTIALALAAAAQAAPTADAGWETISSEEGFGYFVDPASIVRDGATTRVRIRAVSPTPQANGLTTLIIESSMNCANSTAVTTAMEGFDTAGTSLGRFEIPEAQRQTETLQQGGPDAALFRRVCGAAAQ